MPEVLIEIAPDALRLMQQGWPTRIISLIGDDLRFDLPSFGPHHFIARLHDVDAETDGYVAPEPAVLKAGWSTRQASATPTGFSSPAMLARAGRPPWHFLIAAGMARAKLGRRSNHFGL